MADAAPNSTPAGSTPASAAPSTPAPSCPASADLLPGLIVPITRSDTSPQHRDR